MAERMTLEKRIESYIRDFESNGIPYDKDFVIEQVTEQYPGETMEPNEWRWRVSYSAIYPTREDKDTEEAINIQLES